MVFDILFYSGNSVTVTDRDERVNFEVGQLNFILEILESKERNAKIVQIVPSKDKV